MSSPGAKASRSGALRWASWLTRRVTSRNSVARQADVVLVGVGQELSKVGELAVDQPRVEGDRPCPEDGLVAAAADLDLLDAVWETIRASSRSARAGMFASSSPSMPRLELGALDREPVGVGGDHRHLARRRR